MDYEVQVDQVVDAILVYHREKCIDMHVQADSSRRDAEYYKAEAAREIMMVLGKALFKKKDLPVYKKAIQDRLSAVYEAVFFDPASRGKIKQIRGNNNGGQQ